MLTVNYLSSPSHVVLLLNVGGDIFRFCWRLKKMNDQIRELKYKENKIEFWNK